MVVGKHHNGSEILEPSIVQNNSVFVQKPRKAATVLTIALFFFMMAWSLAFVSTSNAQSKDQCEALGAYLNDLENIFKREGANTGKVMLHIQKGADC